LLTGDFLHPDFAGVRDFLASRDEITVNEASLPDVPPGIRDVIALCQARPGQFSQAQVEILHANSPLGHLLAILGSWCEGELRSGRPWHGVERVYWYDAVGRLRWLLSADSPPACRTHAPAERIERSVAGWPNAIGGTTAVIVAPRRDDYEPLADICRALQIAPRWQRTAPPEGPEPDLLVLSADDLQAGRSMEAFAGFRRAWPGARRIALLNFPRQEEIALLLEGGFHHVLGKPLLLTDLLGCLAGLWATVPLRQVAAS